MADGGFHEEAGRDAYLAVFHAALAFIGAQTGKEPKTHSGTRSEFARVAREDVRIPPGFGAFLAKTYSLKVIADSEGGETISREEAEATLTTAAQLVEAIASIIAPPQSA